MRGYTGNVHKEPRPPKIDKSERLGDYPQIHIIPPEDGDEWDIWLNTGTGDYDGQCIGIGKTREEAMANAKKHLEGCLELLKTGEKR